MSVLKARRHESRAEFVNVADEIYVETLNFLSRLSNRYQRLLSRDTMHCASIVLDNAEQAQNIRITDNVSYELRKRHLLEARSGVMALDVHMTHIWQVLMLNPEGAFTDTKGRMKTEKEAIEILDKMAVSLGEKIDHEKNLLTKVLESDAKHYKNKIMGALL